MSSLSLTCDLRSEDVHAGVSHVRFSLTSAVAYVVFVRVVRASVLRPAGERLRHSAEVTGMTQRARYRVYNASDEAMS